MTISPGQPCDSCQPLHLLLTWYQVMGCLKTYFYAKIAGACPTVQYLVMQVHCVVGKSWSCLGRKWSINSARCYLYHAYCHSRVRKHFPGRLMLLFQYCKNYSISRYRPWPMVKELHARSCLAMCCACGLFLSKALEKASGDLGCSLMLRPAPDHDSIACKSVAMAEAID